MTKLQFFSYYGLSAWNIAAGNHTWNHNDRVEEETSQILEEWYDDYLAEHV